MSAPASWERSDLREPWRLPMRKEPSRDPEARRLLKDAEEELKDALNDSASTPSLELLRDACSSDIDIAPPPSTLPQNELRVLLP